MKSVSSFRRWMAVTAVFAALMLAAAPVAAENWGANGWAKGGLGPPPYCDNLQTSECIANNGYHYVYFYNVDSNQYNATISRMENVYDPIIGVAVWETSSLDSADVIVMDGYYGTSEYAGWTQCTDGAAHGGSGRREWCRPQLIMYNLSQTEYFFNGSSRRRMIACHELGHTLGLQHRSGSCMYRLANTSETIPQHEIDHLEDDLY
jgi:hypothetical protein